MITNCYIARGRAAYHSTVRIIALLLALYLAGTLAMLFVFAEKSSSYMRHYGHLAILFTALLWLGAARRARRFALQGGALAVLDQIQQQLEHLRLDVDGLAVTPQLEARGVELAIPDAIRHGWLFSVVVTILHESSTVCSFLWRGNAAH